MAGGVPLQGASNRLHAVMLSVGIVFHVVFIFTMIDAYFRSPLVHGMPTNASPVTPPAKRLVLFVADGLRADKFFELENGKTRAPYLRDIVENKGAWGVSHARVPTESRPGHVALIAGFYEDLSAVTTGWQHNPVHFDSVFNQTRSTWSWGSPDILPMFSDRHAHVHASCYDPDEEDFGSGTAHLLDAWVFEQLKAFLSEASSNAELRTEVHEDRTLYFLHLLGLDTNGHAYNPYSQEYYDNIRYVDGEVERAVALIDRFFGDEKTAYVFTADHGMSNRGSHGDGEAANTETPLVAWGSGVRGPQAPTPSSQTILGSPQCHDAVCRHNAEVQSRGWGLGNILRSDVMQADVASLMTSLIGTAYPVNSVGIIPLDYLSSPGGDTDQLRAEALRANALQVLEQYKTKASQKKERSLLFFPYADLDQENIETLTAEGALLLREGRFHESLGQSRALITAALGGLYYFQTYDLPFLVFIVASGYLGWIAFVTMFVVEHFSEAGHQLKSNHSQAHHPWQRYVHFAGVLVFLCACAVFVAEHAPLQYYFYVGFPAFFWTYVTSKALAFQRQRGGFGLICLDFCETLGLVILCVVLCEFFVIGYFHREIFTALFVPVAVWPVFNPVLRRNWQLCAVWATSMLATSLFPLIPVDYGEDIRLVAVGGVLLMVVSLGTLVFQPSMDLVGQDAAVFKPRGVIVSLCVLAGVSVWVVLDTTQRLSSKAGLPEFNQTLTWSVAGAALLLPTVSGPHFYYRLLSIYLAFGVPFLLLSISFEMIFYCFLGISVMTWLVLETELAGAVGGVRKKDGMTGLRSAVAVSATGPLRALQLSDIRTALFFLMFVNVAFFGTGNIASISSFNISSTYRFCTRFNPFLMGALLVLKIVTPMVFIASVFGVINRITSLPPMCMFYVVVALSDVMALTFFFLVRDYGSWLEIGSSISHFAISNAQIIYIQLLFIVAQALTLGVTIHTKKKTV